MVTPAAGNNTFSRVITTLSAAGLALTLLICAGRLARAQLGPQERYFTSLHDVDCSFPGNSKREFLDEVQYLSGLPEQLNVLDAELADRLTEAFGRHPRVAGIESVRLGQSPKIAIGLRFR